MTSRKHACTLGETGNQPMIIQRTNVQCEQPNSESACASRMDIMSNNRCPVTANAQVDPRRTNRRNSRNHVTRGVQLNSSSGVIYCVYTAPLRYVTLPERWARCLCWNRASDLRPRTHGILSGIRHVWFAAQGTMRNLNVSSVCACAQCADFRSFLFKLRLEKNRRLISCLYIPRRQVSYNARIGLHTPMWNRKMSITVHAIVSGM